MKLLDRHVEATTLKSCALVAVGLTLLFSLLDFVEQLRDVGRGHYRLVDALLNVVLGMPAELLQLTPVSALLGCLLALGSLAASQELTAMRAAGISERRIIGWVFKLGVPIMLALFMVAQFVVPPASRLALAQRSARLAPADAVRIGDGYWAHGKDSYLNVGHFTGGGTPQDISVYRFADDGSLVGYLHAQRAKVRADGTWLMSDVLKKRFESDAVHTDHLPSLTWHSFLRPAQVQLLTLPPQGMAPLALWQYVADLHAQGQSAARYEQELWRQISIPLSTAAMVLIAAPFVFGPMRAHSTGQRITVGAAIGIVFTLVQQIVDYLGVLLNFNPALTVLAPSLLLFLLAYGLGKRSHLLA